ncbi:MAG: hypothetical protein GY842_03225 [bacterium]|nr:hypothetical protein [bacterium]
MAYSTTNNSANNAEPFELSVDPKDGTGYLVAIQPHDSSVARQTLAGGCSHTFTAYIPVP